VRNVDDMKTVSGIFWNRLKIGQALGSDATLSYILGDSTAAHTIAQTKIYSPYNTYVNAGLPPGPICSRRWTRLRRQSIPPRLIIIISSPTRLPQNNFF